MQPTYVYMNAYVGGCMHVWIATCMDACVYRCTKTSIYMSIHQTITSVDGFVQPYIPPSLHSRLTHPSSQLYIHAHMHIAYTLVYSCDYGCVCEHIYYLLAIRQYHVQIDKPNQSVLHGVHQRSLLALKHPQLYKNIQGMRVDFRMAFEKSAPGTNPLYHLQKEEENTRYKVHI